MLSVFCQTSSKIDHLFILVFWHFDNDLYVDMLVFGYVDVFYAQYIQNNDIHQKLYEMLVC